MSAAVTKAILKAIRIIKALFDGTIKELGEGAIKAVLLLATAILLIMMFFVIPVVMHERVPIATRDQAMNYFKAAREISDMTKSPCDDGVDIDWQEVMAVDAVRLKQNYKKSSLGEAKSIARHFIEEYGTCKHCTGEGEQQSCTTYTTYRLRKLANILDDFDIKYEDYEKYRKMDFAFLIGIPAASEYNQLFDGDIKWPLPGNHSISSQYGERIHPITKKASFHYGIDIPAPEGTPIKTPAPGKVIKTSYSSAVGYTIEIDHGTSESGTRLVTRYCHLKKIIAIKNNTVSKGETIGLVGNTGFLSTGPHLHFETYVDGYPVDPAPFFSSN